MIQAELFRSARVLLEREIAAHQRAEAALRTTCSELAAIYAHAPVAILLVDQQLRIEKANDLAARFAERETSDLMGLRPGPALGCLNALAHPEGCGSSSACGQCPIRATALDSLRYGAKHDDVEAWVPVSIDGRQELRCLLVSTAPVDFGGRKAMVCVQDVTERKRSQERLEQAHRRTSAILESISDGFNAFDRDWRYTYVNAAAARMVHKTPEELLGKNVWELWPKAAASPFGEAYRRAVAENIPVQVEAFYPEPLNAWFEVRCYPSPDGLTLFFTDTTARKRGEDRLRDTLRKLQSALAEKTVLLKEVHHRVKNNLAVISSLLSMKAEATDVPDARQALEESQQRIRSIALIHEHLYGTDHLDRIEFAEYARQLAAELTVAFGAAGRGIAVRVDAEPIDLPVDQAVPCVLILNELVTNAFKHAFPGQRRGEIEISFRESAGWLQLGIRDNGAGCPSPGSFATGKSLGLGIVDILVKQLDGVLDQVAGSGTHFVLRFPAG